MGAVAPYIPAKQSEFDLWAANFATLITATPPLYGLTDAEALAIQNAYDSWHAAYLLVTSPTTKTAETVGLKDTQRVLCLSVVRPFAQLISLNPGVASGDKIALGLNPRTSVPAPIPAPDGAPDVSVQSAGPLTLYMRYRDPLTSPKVKSKPYGVTRLQIFGKTSATPIVDPLGLAFVKDATKSPLVLIFDSAEGGKQFYFAGRWVVRTGLFSPWSAIGSFTVPSGT